MAVSPVNGTQDAAALAATTQADAAATSDRFLKLLVAQMQNQDPLNPMDNAQVTSQIAQINTVSGIEKLNSTVDGLSGQFVQMQALQGAALVGHEVVLPGNRLSVADKVGQGGFELAADAASVKVEILSASNQVLGSVDLGKQSAGIHGFTWDAKGVAADAALTFRVTASNGNATTGITQTAASPLMRDTVNAVSTSGNTFSLELATSGTVPYSSVKAFN